MTMVLYFGLWHICITRIIGFKWLIAVVHMVLFGFWSIFLKVSRSPLILILPSCSFPSEQRWWARCTTIVSRSMHHHHHHHHTMHVRSPFNCISISTAWSTNCECALKQNVQALSPLLCMCVFFAQLFRCFISVVFFNLFHFPLVDSSLVLLHFFFIFMVNVKNKRQKNKERLLSNNSKPLPLPLCTKKQKTREGEWDRTNELS